MGSSKRLTSSQFQRVRRAGVVLVLLGGGLNASLPHSTTKLLAVLAGLFIGFGVNYIWPVDHE